MNRAHCEQCAMHNTQCRMQKRPSEAMTKQRHRWWWYRIYCNVIEWARNSVLQKKKTKYKKTNNAAT